MAERGECVAVNLVSCFARPVCCITVAAALQQVEQLQNVAIGELGLMLCKPSRN